MRAPRRGEAECRRYWTRNGLGDLEGIRSRLDYVRWLGVDAIWLNPIYPSPGADCGFAAPKKFAGMSSKAPARPASAPW